MSGAQIWLSDVLTSCPQSICMPSMVGCIEHEQSAMSQRSSFASLAPPLLARKGAAKPAMRPQDWAPAKQHDIDDLGWNDMGEARPTLRKAHEPLSDCVHAKAHSRNAGFLTDNAPVHPSNSANRSFTLRLDASRHLSLRLAAIVTNRSGQKLLIEALDRILSEDPPERRP
jgi:hypothetical protein